jgi:hypothetical protein
LEETNSRSELKRVTQLRELCNDFAAKATEKGKIIIDEIALPNEMKTIKVITKYADDDVRRI